jgi:hypothetical protein
MRMKDNRGNELVRVKSHDAVVGQFEESFAGLDAIGTWPAITGDRLFSGGNRQNSFELG